MMKLFNYKIKKQYGQSSYATDEVTASRNLKSCFNLPVSSSTYEYVAIEMLVFRF